MVENTTIEIIDVDIAGMLPGRISAELGIRCPLPKSGLDVLAVARGTMAPTHHDIILDNLSVDRYSRSVSEEEAASDDQGLEEMHRAGGVMLFAWLKLATGSDDVEGRRSGCSQVLLDLQSHVF